MVKNFALQFSFFKEELILATTQLIEKNKIDEETANSLEYELSLMKQYDLNDSNLDLESVKDVNSQIALSEKILRKHKETKDNETLLKRQFHVTPVQLKILDDLAEEEDFKGRGKRSMALRHIINDYMKNKI